MECGHARSRASVNLETPQLQSLSPVPCHNGSPAPHGGGIARGIPSPPQGRHFRVPQAGLCREEVACGHMGTGPTRANTDRLLPHLPPQALPSIQIPVSPHIFTSISWATATSTLPSLSPVSAHPFSLSLWEFPDSLLAVNILNLIPHGPLSPQVRSRSLSFSEPQPPTPMLKSHLILASPPRVPLGTR